MSSRDPSQRQLASLIPALQPYAAHLVNYLRSLDYPAVIVEGRRSAARQRALYAQGRTTPGRIVTNTLASYHTAGRAFDIAWLTPSGSVTFNVPDYFWDAAGRAGEEIGFRWGGRFRLVDKPHFEA